LDVDNYSFVRISVTSQVQGVVTSHISKTSAS